MGADRLALERADHGDVLVSRNAGMVGPEPHQALDETDVGPGSRLITRGRFILENMLRQRRSDGLAGADMEASLAPAVPIASASFLACCASFDRACCSAWKS